MIEKIILDYLRNELEIPSFMEEQPETEGKYILIEKTAGSKTNFIKKATVAIQSYADTLYEAAVLNEDVKAAMDEVVRLNEISKCSLNSDYNYTDTTRKKYRYQAVFDIVHY